MSVPTDSPPTYDISVAGTQPDSPSSRYPLRNLAPLLVPLLLAPLSLLLLTTLGAAPGSPDMSAFFSFLKALLLPALLAALLYALITLLLLPLYRRHKNRYSQYLPLSAPLIPASTDSSLSRPLEASRHLAFSIYTVASDAINTLLPERWRRHKRTVVSARDDDDEEMGGYLSDGDSIGGLDGDGDGVLQGRRDGLSLSMDTTNALRSESRSRSRDDSGRRLSRELEEGFADSSDDEDEDDMPVDRRSRGLR